MQRDTRLARLLHVLIHMHLRGGTTTSETISQMLHTNPAVVRRTMAALRDAGYVSSTVGPGGGWKLEGDFSLLKVSDVYEAIAHADVFAIGRAEDNPACPVEAEVNHFLGQALRSAEQRLVAQFVDKRLSELADAVTSRTALPKT